LKLETVGESHGAAKRATERYFRISAQKKKRAFSARADTEATRLIKDHWRFCDERENPSETLFPNETPWPGLNQRNFLCLL
jgi:hypothetical protein